MNARLQHTPALVLLAALALGTSACSDNNGSAEKLGQKIDRGSESAKEKIEQSADAARSSTRDAVIAAKIRKSRCVAISRSKAASARGSFTFGKASGLGRSVMCENE